MNTIKKIISLSVLFTTLSLMTACGTVKGFGQDVSKAGQDIEKAAGH